MRADGVRAQKVARNRVALLHAARDVFLAEGYHGATVEKIATAAGLTIGAVYSQFGGKAELFLGLLERRIDERLESNRELVAGAAGPDLRELVRRWSELQRRDLAWTLLVLEFRVHAARDPQLNARYGELHDRTLTGLAAVVEQAAGVDPAEARALAQVIFAMGNGAVLEQAVEPDAMDGEAAADHVARMLGGRA